MGLLKVGVPQKWDDSKKNLGYVRNAGLKQFISTYNRVKGLKGDELLWGDEIEYGIFELDHKNRKARIALRGREIMDDLNSKENKFSQNVEGCNWVPEYGAWMVEATPNRPYTGFTTDLLRVERNMRLRRKRMLTALGEDEIAPTVSIFPMLGALGGDGSVPPTPVGGPRTLSDYIGDGIINPHPRFGTLSENIRSRRGEKVNIRVPLFRDIGTPEFKDYPVKAMPDNVDGCCGSDSQQLWRYGKGDASREKYGDHAVVVGCSTSSLDEANSEELEVLHKWLVDVKCEGCRGLYYRSAPGVIVPDADWPRNGETVTGSEIPNIPGWVRLQNGYYLPLASEDGKIKFLHRISERTTTKVAEESVVGASTPLFRNGDTPVNGNVDISSLMENNLSLEKPAATTKNAKPTDSSENVRAAIHMDAMAFGMGCCCLQVTFQAKDIEESRFMYDQLAVLAPVMMALTASTPLVRGRIADTDARWGMISESVDCRTPTERGHPDGTPPDPALAGQGQRRIYKSRYDSISTYIYQGALSREEVSNPLNVGVQNRVLNMYNDLPVPIDEESYKKLREAGVDPALSQHIAHLFIRDPLVIFDGAVKEVDDEIQTEHFENIQSTNWNTVRWKPPPPRNNPNDPHIGWRTEFRSMEMQLTDFENAAFAVFTVLVTRVILTFDLNLYIPLSRVDANMQRAHSRNASAKGKFFFRRHLAPLEQGDDGFGRHYSSMFFQAANGEAKNGGSSDADIDVDENGVSIQRKAAPRAPGSVEENSYEEMTMAEIMTGKGEYYPGLVPLVRAYLDYIQCDSITRERLNTYLNFIEKRATGELITPATWMRNFVRSHPEYKGDSVVTDGIAYDLLKACRDIGLGKLHVPELLGDIKIKEIGPDDAYDVKLDSSRAKNDKIVELLKRYSNRKSFFATREGVQS
eukprot:CAMPEP_0118689790 /NCGR_PEP_ID=MMETSP0800-20121206/9691_1 /TAXON_ID=210618 ORGANISM="Striatella unipunctata, Strain CCMP2910" /NCGR_SAMPLE_ID=MMETSP0800 /ASSEMBLY_ACC=CAM_ASM_000638 /LENGTH=919 /DNA_ID=CAMNT_0006587239 /DNA_START=823 /DNA_END=3582 /DNA_ORIENTATION=-